MTTDEQIKWMDENKDTLLRLIRGAGPHREDEEHILETYRQTLMATSAGSEFDDVNVRMTIERVIREIEEVCVEHGLPTHAGVVYGSDAMLGLGIGQRPVLETEASIVEVSVHFLSFCNGIARLLARTIPYCQDDGNVVQVRRDIAALRGILGRNRDLVLDWSEALASFAATGVQPQTPVIPLNEAQSTIRGILLRAIELFAIGHEYGHHSLRHGRVTTTEDSATDAFQDEDAADLFGRGCSMAIGIREDEQNFYAVSGAGGVLILGSLDLIRRVRAVLETGQDDPPPRSHHPPYPDRVANLGLLDAKLPEGDRQRAADFRRFIVDALDGVWEFVRPIILEYHNSGIRPTQDPTASAGWLPS
ncbi:hypothetical protein Bra471DRAFT_03791 [Bradyrhizobium sp. WSM471]|nr:hypothetical protein Bra471DRAFT_03791 [Bradyrhizobium sp. WSM471]